MLQKDLDQLQEWATTWNMRFHPGKCKVLKIGKWRGRRFKAKGQIHSMNSVDKKRAEQARKGPTPLNDLCMKRVA